MLKPFLEFFYVCKLLGLLERYFWRILFGTFFKKVLVLVFLIFDFFVDGYQLQGHVGRVELHDYVLASPCCLRSGEEELSYANYIFVVGDMARFLFRLLYDFLDWRHCYVSGQNGMFIYKRPFNF